MTSELRRASYIRVGEVDTDTKTIACDAVIMCPICERELTGESRRDTYKHLKRCRQIKEAQSNAN